MKDPQLRSNPPAAEHPIGPNLGPYDQQEHRYDKGHPDVHDTFRRIRSVIDEYEGDRFTIGEIHIFDWEEWASYYGGGDELHMPYNFSLLYAPWSAGAFRELVDAMESVLPAHAWPNLVLGNHDEERMMSRYGPERARVAAMALLSLRGTPTMYYGDEIGMKEATLPSALRQDPWLRAGGATRDGCRTPMQWVGSSNGGFAPPDTIPWLPVSTDLATTNVATQLADPNSLLSLYRDLLSLRHRSAALHSGDYRPVASPAAVFAYARRHGTEELIIALNFGAEPEVVDIAAGSQLVLATTPAAARLESGSLRLEGNAGAIVVVS
jgi:glycosidase